MLLLALACAPDPSSDKPGLDDPTGADGPGAADSADPGADQLACPDGWRTTFTLVDDGCNVGTTTASGGAILCREAGEFLVPWVDGTSLTLACPVEGDITCTGENRGAWWENTGTATGTLTPTALSADWSIAMTWSTDEGATNASCTTSGTLSAAP